MNKAKILFLACGVGISTLLSVGCAKKDPAELVRQRAIERWDLLAEKHAVKAYDYLSPGYRSTHTLEQYVAFVATARVQWKAAKVESVQCEEGDVCTAKLTVVTVLPGAVIQRPSDMEYPAPVVEKWVRSDGEWYFLPDSKVEGKNIAGEAASTQVLIPTAPPASASPPTQPAADKDNKENHQ
jgi:hypothetical protein